MRAQIRLGNSNDASEIETLLAESFKEFKPFYTKAAFDATAIMTDEIINRMNEGPVWVALHKGKIIGTVAAVTKDNSIYIRGMAVSPSARSQGIGEMLLKVIEKYALEMNCNRLYLGTTQYLKSAIRLYDRNGYKRYNVQDFYGMELIMMEKFLK